MGGGNLGMKVGVFKWGVIKRLDLQQICKMSGRVQFARLVPGIMVDRCSMR